MRLNGDARLIPSMQALSIVAKRVKLLQRIVRLEFAAFSVKNRAMIASVTALRTGRDACGRFTRLAFSVVLFGVLSASTAQAQFFTDRPPPVPPANVPDVPTPSGPAISLAPPSGPAATPGLPSTLTAPPVTTALPPQVPPTQGQAVLALNARFAKDMPITSGVVWRIYSDKPDATGAFQLVREDRTATPNIVLAPGGYVVHAALGLVSAVRPVTLRTETLREQFDLPAGGLRIEGRVGTSKIPQGQITFSIYKGSQFELGDRAPIATNVAAGDVVLVPEGVYYIISNYGDANSVVRSDIRVQMSKLTDVTVTHRAAVITLKLVGTQGGEALANTAWSVITPAGDVIKEYNGAFPRVVLSEGEYRAIAKNEGKVFERPFNVVNGVDGEVEVLTK
jgi:hypothetical protein